MSSWEAEKFNPYNLDSIKIKIPLSKFRLHFMLFCCKMSIVEILRFYCHKSKNLVFCKICALGAHGIKNTGCSWFCDYNLCPFSCRGGINHFWWSQGFHSFKQSWNQSGGLMRTWKDFSTKYWALWVEPLAKLITAK